LPTFGSKSAIVARWPGPGPPRNAYARPAPPGAPTADVGEAVQVAVGERRDRLTDRARPLIPFVNVNAGVSEGFGVSPDEDIEPSHVGGPAVEARRADHEVAQTVAIDITAARDRPAETLKRLDALVLAHRGCCSSSDRAFPA
jgi:hypothetical protein